MNVFDKQIRIKIDNYNCPQNIIILWSVVEKMHVQRIAEGRKGLESDLTVIAFLAWGSLQFGYF